MPSVTQAHRGRARRLPRPRAGCSVALGPTGDSRRANDYGANRVIVRVRPDVYAAYGHFQPGSVAVEEGDRVTTGQRLGLLGNTDNSTAPHLHFGLIDGPNLTGAYGLPFVI
ncbi:MAG: M23 family metallopeptidase, partial [Thermoleophilaceae bacterium]|nr:M23 family metallopeptidase [Thermoleophilaceae bacterium]